VSPDRRQKQSCLCYSYSSSRVPSERVTRSCSPALPACKGERQSRGLPYPSSLREHTSALRPSLQPTSSAASAGAKLVEKRSHRRAPTCSRARLRCAALAIQFPRFQGACSTSTKALVSAAGNSASRARRGVRVTAKNGQPGARQTPDSRSRYAGRSRSVPSNDVHVCRPRGAVCGADRFARTDPLLGAISVESQRGTSVVGVEAGEGSLDIIE
jgi:hypothetical protein